MTDHPTYDDYVAVELAYLDSCTPSLIDLSNDSLFLSIEEWEALNRSDFETATEENVYYGEPFWNEFGYMTLGTLSRIVFLLVAVLSVLYVLT